MVSRQYTLSLAPPTGEATLLPGDLVSGGQAPDIVYSVEAHSSCPFFICKLWILLISTWFKVQLRRHMWNFFPRTFLRNIKYYINISWSMWRVFEHHQFQPSWSLYQANWLSWQSMDAKKHTKMQPFGPTAESCSPATWFPSKDLTNQFRAPSLVNIWTPRGISLSSLSLDSLWCFPSHSTHYIVLSKKHSHLLPWSLAGWTYPSQPLTGRLIG